MRHNFIVLVSVSVFCLLLTASLLVVVVVSTSDGDHENYYELLGVGKDADNRDIRKAFKRLALSKHPDKNKSDPKAHENFLKITRAYEVLKDEEMRKKYDQFGEDGLKDDSSGHRYQYHSWKYYNEDFGIYDNDEEIITLSKSDFETSVTNSPYVWFINYYSPQCSHCHHLAPDWRKLAKELDSVIRIGAVNCEEEWILCRQQGIRSYPSLIFYPESDSYEGKRETQSMVEYVLNKLQPRMTTIDRFNLNAFYTHTVDEDDDDNQLKTKPANQWWLLMFCVNNKDCAFQDTQQMVAIMLENVVEVAQVFCDSDDKQVCDHYGIHESKIALFQDISGDHHNYFEIANSDQSVEAKQIFKAVLAKLPNVKKLSTKELRTVWHNLGTDLSTDPWIVEFTLSDEDKEVNQYETKRLAALVGDESLNVGKVFCDREPQACSQFFISKYPTIAVLNAGPTYELYHGRILAFDIANFAKESLSSRLQTLDPILFEDKVQNPVSTDKPWFVDFFAPWCPPCMRLMPEIRKASRSANHLVNFGTIDCTIHSTMCRQYNIKSYPTVLLYNSSIAHQFHGSHSEQDLIDFIHETLVPSVVHLTPESFKESVDNKKGNSFWLVDFFAPWCGPCQRLAPQWTKLAKLLKEEPNVNVGSVDCQAYAQLCSDAGVSSYPTIRLYPSKDSKYYSKTQKFNKYNGNNRDAESLRVWAYNFIPSTVKEITSEDMFKKLIKSDTVWLIDFYAPWCSHCTYFAPEFEVISKKLKGKVKTGKVDCQSFRQLCRDAGVNAYPTLKLYKKSAKGVAIDGQSAKEIIPIVEDFLSDDNQDNIIRDEL
ncbi:dnaJ homolog subfamily C member 10-like [Oppia nitens]|uniref:dnaJ homolog subfamily C member 10-like n=1 Tax=Oppia nitens TaxID=1686743 RepID=UPI0023DBEEEC|nr:dnaJ homolog subfamily C member 10-like [Oppia nitens]